MDLKELSRFVIPPFFSCDLGVYPLNDLRSLFLCAESVSWIEILESSIRLLTSLVKTSSEILSRTCSSLNFLILLARMEEFWLSQLLIDNLLMNLTFSYFLNMFHLLAPSFWLCLSTSSWLSTT